MGAVFKREGISAEGSATMEEFKGSIASAQSSEEAVSAEESESV